MPRVSKKDTSRKTKQQEVEDELDEVENEIIEESDDEEIPKKSSRKTAAKGKKTVTKNTGRSRTSKKASQEEDQEEDHLSDLDVDDDAPIVESSDNDKVVPGGRRPRQRKEIDMTLPIGEMSTEDILTVLKYRGEDNLNPQLRQGAMDLLNTLRGARPGFRRRRYGSKSNISANPEWRQTSMRGNRGGDYHRGSYRGGRGGHRNERTNLASGENLYDD